MTIESVFESLPVSEKALWKHINEYPFELANDRGQVNLFRVLVKGKELGAVKYHGGRKLTFYSLR